MPAEIAQQGTPEMRSEAQNCAQDIYTGVEQTVKPNSFTFMSSAVV